MLKHYHLVPILIAGALLLPGKAFAWDEEGHKIVALIADHYLDPAVKQKVDAMLAADTDTLTKHDIASEAVWADTHRDLDRQKAQKQMAVTDSWHEVKLEISHPDMKAACPYQKLPAGKAASEGPADCAVDKVGQFAGKAAGAEISAEPSRRPASATLCQRRQQRGWQRDPRVGRRRGTRDPPALLGCRVPRLSGR